MARIAELSVVFLSYDEPRREDFWRDLKGKCPTARRVDGVKGLDRAFQAAVAAGDTAHVITIDADSIVEPVFFELDLDDDLLQPGLRIDWPARNAVNGLVYGNGGIKCWPKALAAAMRARDDAEAGEKGIGFPPSAGERCPAEPHLPMSTTHANGSPLQAFRAGFREGVRLGLPARGAPGVGPAETLSPVGLQRLLTWCSIGGDVENGLWCVYGARLGCRMTRLSGWDPLAINDFDWFEAFWRETVAPRFRGDDARCAHTGYGWDRGRLAGGIARLGDTLRRRLGLVVVEVDADQSRLFKQVHCPEVALSRSDQLGTVHLRSGAPAGGPAKAKLCYETAAAAGYPNALNNLARMYRTGEGAPADPARAAHLLREASALGNPYAPHQLGRMVRAGQGVERDPAQAIRLFSCAAGRGFAAAHAELGEMYEQGEGTAPDLALALHHYRLALAERADLKEKVDQLAQRLAELS